MTAGQRGIQEFPDKSAASAAFLSLPGKDKVEVVIKSAASDLEHHFFAISGCPCRPNKI